MNINKPIEKIYASFLKGNVLGVFPKDDGYPFYPGVRYGLIKNNETKFINSWQQMENTVCLRSEDAIPFLRFRTSRLIYFSEPLLFSERFLEILVRENLRWDASFGIEAKLNFDKFKKSEYNIVSNIDVASDFRKYPLLEINNGYFRVTRLLINSRKNVYKVVEHVSSSGMLLYESRQLMSPKILSIDIRMPWHK